MSVEEIVPGLFRLSIPIVEGGSGWTTPYVLRGNDGITLFDAGYGTRAAAAALTEQLAEIGHTPAEVRRVVVSHAHMDHMGMVRWLKHQSADCELVMIGKERLRFGGSGTREEVERRQHDWALKHGLEMDSALEKTQDGPARWGIEERDLDREMRAARNEEQASEPRHAPLRPLQPDVRLEDGDEFVFGGWRLQAVWTPGHTLGHLCLYDPDHHLTFTGDHVLSRITPNVSYGSDDEESGRSPLREYRASLEKVAALDTVRGLPAHQATIADLPARCHEILDHHAERLDEVLEGVGGGRRNATEISAAVHWSSPYDTFGVFKRRQALGEALAHLVLLEDDGRVRRIETETGVLWERL